MCLCKFWVLRSRTKDPSLLACSSSSSGYSSPSTSSSASSSSTAICLGLYVVFYSEDLCFILFNSASTLAFFSISSMSFYILLLSWLNRLTFSDILLLLFIKCSLVSNICILIYLLIISIQNTQQHNQITNLKILT